MVLLHRSIHLTSLPQTLHTASTDSWPGNPRTSTQSNICRSRAAWSERYEDAGMSSLTPVEEDSLLSPEEVQAQKEWDEEFERRKEDLARQQLKSRERRRAVSDRMAELRDRWQGVERRRQLRSREGREDNSSVSLSVPTNTTSNTGGCDMNNNSHSREASSLSPGLNR
ncbi:hypothetical protein PoB_006005700 [Plakobranchus ocellatus]|uniref:Uncharacterized protein n=1 Tax=Plakobranchus ocellatus TaxID=259542 RepID=A0AAV4CNX0_9GAST|nr:hypothetical protein PoB_006005700 [Plakobranchus ocellatus]